MSKCAQSNDDNEPGLKQLRVEEDITALYDQHAWGILHQFLTTNMTMLEMDNTLASYLSDRYFANDWVEPQCALFSGEGDDGKSLANLDQLMAKHVTPTAPSPPPKDSSASISTSRVASCLSSSCRGRSHGPPKSTHNPYIIVEASEDEDENDDEEEDNEDEGRQLEQSQKVMHSLGLLAKERLAKKINDLANRFKENLGNSSQGHCALTSRATSIPLSALKALAPQSRMYLLYIQRTAMEYITEHLQSQNLPITILAWVAGQLYIVADSPKMICDSLPTLHSLAIKQCLCITDAEREAVEGSLFQLPDPAWVKVKHALHRGYIGRVESQTESSVKVLIPPSRFPYPMPQGTQALLNQSHLPTNKIISNIIHDNEVVGWTYEGQSYFMGLLLKDFLRDNLELLASPHIDNIWLHLKSRWDKPFLKKAVVLFSMQFLHTGDWARVIRGSLHGESGQVILMDHAVGSASLEFTFNGHPEQIEVCLKDIERIFWVSNTIKVVADITNQQVEVSKYYLDWCPLNHTVHLQLPMQQYLEPPADSDSIEIGDHIEVLEGKHVGKCSIVDWYAKGSTHLWFWDVITQDGRETSSELSSIRVPVAIVQQTSLTCTIQYTKDKGYDVRPGDIMTVACGPEYQAKGVVHSIDIPNTHLTILCDDDQSLITRKSSLFVATGRATEPHSTLFPWRPVLLLCMGNSASHSNCMTLLPGPSPSSSNIWSTWSASSEADKAHDATLSINPTSSTHDPWTVAQDSKAEKLLDSTCPNPFCSDNGPVPEGYVAAFCTSNGQSEPSSSMQEKPTVPCSGWGSLQGTWNYCELLDEEKDR
ncbi:uncharacterized protein BJ212DRAFT_1305940 [Suillus subaureus]|uniref:Uncharacterized protein n=1 Tax=Suillus subaureus TaxID=48587 RepID=A0A9P7IZI4_9AGAM|nr:uncharacterized protein BJ212DRAFT_1305940 [Suillus subaureus]KAG1797622.1 hypothetical protein BJ212DRAFT_1305940 [Suillus subaureus]